MLDMDNFDSSLFDLPFEDLASLGIDAQQQQAPAAIDFQDFCKDFATTDFALEPLDNQMPAWSFESVTDPATDSSAKDAGITAKSEDFSNTAKSEDFLSSLDKSVFDPLEPFGSSFDDMFGSSVGNDAQVVPDIAPMQAHAPEFSMPSYTQASYVQPKTVGVTPGPTTRPYSWMNGIDYASFGWPARTRLPSESPLCLHTFQLMCCCCVCVSAGSLTLLLSASLAALNMLHALCCWVHFSGHYAAICHAERLLVLSDTPCNPNCDFLQVILLPDSSLWSGIVTRRQGALITVPKLDMKCAKSMQTSVHGSKGGLSSPRSCKATSTLRLSYTEPQLGCHFSGQDSRRLVLLYVRLSRPDK